MGNGSVSRFCWAQDRKANSWTGSDFTARGRHLGLNWSRHQDRDETPPPPPRPAVRPRASLPAPARGGGLLLGRPARPLVTRSSLDVPAVLRPSARAGVTRLGLPLCGPGRRLGLSVPLRFPGRGCWTGAAGHQSPSGALGDGSVPDIPLMSVYNSARPTSFLGNSVEERNLKKKSTRKFGKSSPGRTRVLGPRSPPPGPLEWQRQCHRTGLTPLHC